jgi:hypothetical protein
MTHEPGAPRTPEPPNFGGGWSGGTVRCFLDGTHRLEHFPITLTLSVIARLDRAIQYSRPVFSGSPGQAGR